MDDHTLLVVDTIGIWLTLLVVLFSAWRFRP